MTNRGYRILYSLLLTSCSLLLLSCHPNNEHRGRQQPQLGVQQTFLASQQEYDLRVAVSSWEAGDQLGLYVRRTALDALWATDQVLHSNLHYKTIQGGSLATFEPYDELQKVNWDSSMMYDILAYYPYSAEVQDGAILYSVADQMTLQPLLISDNLSGISPDDTKQLLFRQGLTSLRFEMSSEDGGDLAGVTVQIVGMPTKGKLDLYSRQWIVDEGSIDHIQLPVMVAGATATATALLLPIEETTSDMKVLFTLPNGRTYTWPLRMGQSLVMGQQRVYTITLRDTGTAIVTPSVGYIELPADKAIPNTLRVQHMLPSNPSERNYFLLYNTQLHLAHYVAYPLYDDLMGSGRYTSWREDPQIPASFQPNLSSSYVDGYSRGHQIPNADRNASTQLCHTTYYYSNMVPQDQLHNGGIWSDLEGRVRSLAQSVDTLYVVTGVGFDDSNYTYAHDKDNMACPVPDYFYKVVAWQDDQGRWHVKAWDVPHTGFGELDSHESTITDLETKTGFDFFPALNQINVIND